MSIVSPVNSNNNLCCINLMLSETEALGGIAPSLEQRSAGATKALYSPINGGALAVIEDGKEKPSATSSRKVKVKYTTKECTTGSTTPITKCNLTATDAGNPFKFADVEITKTFNWKFKINDEQIRTMCENRVEFYNTVLRLRLDAAIQGFNNVVLAQLATLMGKYPITGDESLISPINIPVVTSNGVANPAGLSLLKTIYQQMNQNDDAIIVGAGKLDFFGNALAYSGLSSNGINAGGATINNLFRDANVNNVAPFAGKGTDNILTWLPGAIRPVEFYQNSGDFVEKGATISVGGRNYYEKEYGQVELGGLKWDYFMERNCDEWVFAFQKQFEIVPLPADAFGDCQNYNYALAFQLGCGDVSCDLINSVTTPELITT